MAKQRIEIRNFGPIKHVDLDISDYTIFIGPNASGKSTIAKLVYFFRSLHFDLPWADLQEKMENNDVRLQFIARTIEKEFKSNWDIQALQDDFSVRFYTDYNSTNKNTPAVVLTKVKKSLHVELNKAFQDGVKDVFQDGVKSHQGFPYCSYHIAKFFNDSHNALYIPAGRQLLSLPKDNLPLISEKRVDPFLEDFMKIVERFRGEFSEPLSERREKAKTFQPTLMRGGDESLRRKARIDLNAKLYTEILKGDYVSTREGERIYITEKQFVKLFEASSGQQEALWILNIIYLLLSDQFYLYSGIVPDFVIFEEPEAHLYPETQKHITELISLLANKSNNQVMITTHSPYILSALNNLLYAHKIGKSKPDEVAAIIDPLLWVDIDRVAAYKVENGTIRDIVDRDMAMIIPEEIDSVPKDPIVEDYEKLFDLDDVSDAEPE